MTTSNSLPHRGGARDGAGRKPLSATSPTVKTLITLTQAHKEKLQAFGGSRWIREQIEATQKVLDFAKLPEGAVPVAIRTHLTVPMTEGSVQAGFPSPAESYEEDAIDFNELLIDCAPATFVIRAMGESMINAGIAEGDLLVVDRSREARSGDIVIMRINNEFTVKRLMKTAQGIYLHPENTSGLFKDIYPEENDEWTLFGVVNHVIKSF